MLSADDYAKSVDELISDLRRDLEGANVSQLRYQNTQMR